MMTTLAELEFGSQRRRGSAEAASGQKALPTAPLEACHRCWKEADEFAASITPRRFPPTLLACTDEVSNEET
jgi:hypothetical protein